MAESHIAGVQDLPATRDEELSHEPLARGLFRLDISGRILHFTAHQENGIPVTGTHEELVGKNFFDELAPCIRLRDARTRFAEGVRRRDLFETLECTCKCPGMESVRVTLYYSRISDTAWALVE